MSYLSPGVKDQIRRQKRFEVALARRRAVAPPADGVVTDHIGSDHVGSLRETYRQVYPKHLPPDHLAEAMEVFERAEREPVRAVITLPRGAGKTEMLMAAAAHRLRGDPSCRVVYGSYGQRLSNSKSGRMRTLASALGVPVDRSSTSKQHWMTGVDDGGLWATSVGGAIVGERSKLLLLDDLFRGRADAESSLTRDKTYDWVMADAMGSMLPDASVVLTSTRWHEDDVSGRLIAAGWHEVCVPALTPDGASYWPAFWPLEALLRKREDLGGSDGYDWTSLYMGAPRPSGTAIFRDRVVWDSQPLREHMRVWIGVDPAYSGKKSADYSAAVVLGEHAGRCYVLDVFRRKASQEQFAKAVRELHDTWRPDGVVCYVNKTEQNIRSLFREVGLEVALEFTTTGKVEHARPASYWWNSRRILTPPKAAWVDDLVSEVVGFPGKNDDQVDCLAAAFLKLVGHRMDWSSADRLQAHVPKAFDPETGMAGDDWDY